MKSLDKSPQEKILGINFFSGESKEAARLLSNGGLLLVAASPALTKLRYDENYRSALQAADVILLDSSFVVSAWRNLSGRSVPKISGITYLKALLEVAEFSCGHEALWIVSSEKARSAASQYLEKEGLDGGPQRFYLAGNKRAEDHALLLKLEEQRPEHIVIATEGQQEAMGLYLRDYLLYKPAIHCVGSALAFLSGVERPIPTWAERARVGWLCRLSSQPHMLLPRLGLAARLLLMLIRYRAELPPLRPRWSDI